MDIARRFKVGTVYLSCVDLRSSIDAIFRQLAVNAGGYVACTCMHGIVESEHDIALRGILNGSFLTLPDGMPTVWVGRAKGAPVARVTAPDFLEALMQDPRATHVRHYFFGGTERTLAAIVQRAARLVGRDAVAGAWSPPMRPAGVDEDPAILARIAAARPDILWVGLGLPKQEYWMARYAASFPSAILVGVGAAFDWFAGAQPRAPKWLQRAGLEWAHRVACEPRRLWPRYRNVVPHALRILFSELRLPLARRPVGDG
jgi:N-acetylglucosaminyldiphosphoundecaprenol N-acetyl-beta-D-mannosaminyltransferase